MPGILHTGSHLVHQKLCEVGITAHILHMRKQPQRLATCPRSYWQEIVDLGCELTSNSKTPSSHKLGNTASQRHN